MSPRAHRFRRSADSKREPLLYVSPVMPAPHGNGLAMRAAHTLLALGTRYAVSLLVVPRYGSPAGTSVPAAVRAACAHVAIAHPGALGEPILDEQGRPLPPDAGETVLVFRLASVPAAEPWLARAAPGGRWLDLDDVESATQRRIAALHRLHGDRAGAEAAEQAAAVAEIAERDALDRFDRVWLASPADLARLSPRVPGQLALLPNALPPAAPLPPAPADGPFTLLFVGTLDYFPNVDAVLWFGREVLPLIRRESARAVELRVVGAGWAARYAEIAGLPGVRLVGRAPDLRAEYAAAHAAVVPLRAGGGTRIKAIEAFGLRRPVVGTTIGLEGIAARHEEHALIADEPEPFALACLRLLDEPAFGQAIAERAHALAGAHYSLESLKIRIAAWPRTTGAR